MSQWYDIVNKILKENSIVLNEATIIHTNSYNDFNDGDKLIVIKNPSKEEYNNIKKNSKYNSVRGFVTEDDSVYVWDANLGIHQDVIDTLDDENKKPYDVVLQFSQDENNNIKIDSSFDSKRLNDLLDYKKSKYSNTNTLNAKDILDLNYYDFEILYNGIYKKENEIIQEFANSYSYEYNFDFSKLDYDNKPYNEKDDFKTFMKKAKQIIAKENNINLDEAKQITYRTYADKPYLNDVDGSFANKPSRGLWGCRDNSWKEWCEDNDFGYNPDYFEWTLKPNTKVYTINTEEDFIYLLKKYGSLINSTYGIDYLKLAKDYDAVELTDNGNTHLHYSIDTNDPELQNPQYKSALLLAMNAWDVPSICVFNPSKTVDIIEKPIEEDTVKQGNSWTNKGKEGTHGTFKTKKEADAQRKAMFANGYKG